MPGPENIKEGLVSAFFRVVLNPDDFGVVGGAGADVFVRGVMEATLGVTDFGGGDTGYALKGQFDAPEAARSELRIFLAWVGNVVVGTLGDGGGVY